MYTPPLSGHRSLTAGRGALYKRWVEEDAGLLTTDRVMGGALALLALFVLIESRKLPLGSLQHPGPAHVPVVLALLLLGFAVPIVLRGGRAPLVKGLGWLEWRTAVAILVVCAFDALVLERLGYRVTIALSLLFLLGPVERQHPAVTVLVSGVDAENAVREAAALYREKIRPA